jgi:hypothetical protein
VAAEKMYFSAITAQENLDSILVNVLKSITHLPNMSRIHSTETLRATILVVIVNSILLSVRNSKLDLEQLLFYRKKLKINPSANRAAVHNNSSGKG